MIESVGADLRAAFAGRYDMVRELGQGGSATVYLATDCKHGRPVAIKMLHPQLDATISHRRFLAEIRTTARLQHPHILPLFDSGEAAGRLFFTMPVIEGESLRQRLRRQKYLAIDDVLRIATEVGAALEYAHARGVIHRDIKPENILISATGHSMVADFGIAFAVNESRSLVKTDPELIVGTPLYMSPEQADGLRELDGRSDMYSFACVLYEALTGALPVESEKPHPLLRRLRRPIPPIADKRTGVSRAMDHAIRRAMSMERGERFGSMAEFIHGLQQSTVCDIITFGRPALLRDGRPLADSDVAAHVMALLAILAREGSRGVTRARMVALLWQQHSPETREQMLASTLASIATLMDSQIVVASSERLVLDETTTDSDLARFSTAIGGGRPGDAVGQYHGPFLDGFTLPDSPAFRRWAEQVRAEFELEYAVALERLAREAESQGGYHDAVRWWRKLSAQDPLNGRLAMELMRALVASGDRRAAVQHAQLHQALIEEEIELPIDRAVVKYATELQTS